ncbi:hypothetical protein [Brochothrix campestris]|uniref:Uncharacterized protein n=1 Tax=Brochothrix campestris FSL F6-1037 TaxID=1265861 RepID=W7CIU6_9LIST|nr:hypothetical protein [Brochothrix campestris]EUJ35766.1 hypothetical protein BCAMP_11400 [Brochothrix campestris FSL F6-1037]
MKKITIYTEAHYFKQDHVAYAGYVIKYKGHYKTLTTHSDAIDEQLICLDMLWQAVSTLKAGCDITVVSRKELLTTDMRAGTGSKLWEHLNSLRLQHGHRYSFPTSLSDSDNYYLDAIHEAFASKKEENPFY